MQTDYATDEEIAGHFGVSAPTIWRWVREGKNHFPKPIRLAGRTTRWRWTDVKAWEAARVAESAA